ncbi:MAG: leucine-rich repeat protein, partial [Ruminococcus sp.]|nr:leucine-rich repeat protein [Ruminococcus sp.]
MVMTILHWFTSISSLRVSGSALMGLLLRKTTGTGERSIAESSLRKSASAPDGVFHGCYSLKSAVLPAGLKEIPNGMFYECSSLTEINIPSG